ncbi:MAG: TlpA family protein disulfide reductase [Methylococcaceae bacterium]|nr:TlpA family protein disulfide reductase [Methylococcaceae bacterium]
MKINKKLITFTIATIIGAAAQTSHATEVGQAAPQFTLPTLQQDQPTALKSYAGKVIYLDFWASWCAPCRTSFPLLNKMHEKLKAQGFEVVAINLDEDKAAAEKFLKEFPVSFTVLRDAKGEWADQFVVESMPTSFIIDKQGVVQNIHHGFNSDDIKELEEKVTKLLAQK